MDKAHANAGLSAPSVTSRPAPVVRLVAPPLDAEEVADRLRALGDAFADAGTASQVAMASGYGAAVRVRSGSLSVTDGVGEMRRERSWPRASRDLRRLVVDGDGWVSTEALRWSAQVGVQLAFVHDGMVTLASSPAGRYDPRLVRAQALAGRSSLGLEVARCY
jgi:hypothetical protein